MQEWPFLSPFPECTPVREWLICVLSACPELSVDMQNLKWPLLVQRWALLLFQNNWENFWQETVSSQSIGRLVMEHVSLLQNSHWAAMRLALPPPFLFPHLTFISSFFLKKGQAEGKAAPRLLSVCPNKPWSAEYYVLLCSRGGSEKTLPNLEACGVVNSGDVMSMAILFGKEAEPHASVPFLDWLAPAPTAVGRSLL